MLLGRENPRLARDQIDRIYDVSRSWATKRAVLKLYRATPAATLAGPAAALRPLDRPALVIWGTRDAYLPCEQAERRRQAFPSAQVELLQGHGHWVMLENPERVASLVIPFLRRQLPAPRPRPDHPPARRRVRDPAAAGRSTMARRMLFRAASGATEVEQTGEHIAGYVQRRGANGWWCRLFGKPG